MNIVVLSGSPRKGANTDTMVEAFAETACEIGHTVEAIRVAGKKIAGCLGCQYCFTHEGTCVQKDDMADVIESLKGADMVVFASPRWKCLLSLSRDRGVFPQVSYRTIFNAEK